jgi:hypothetical protein
MELLASEGFRISGDKGVYIPSQHCRPRKRMSPPARLTFWPWRWGTSSSESRKQGPIIVERPERTIRTGLQLGEELRCPKKTGNEREEVREVGSGDFIDLIDVQNEGW